MERLLKLIRMVGMFIVLFSMVLFTLKIIDYLTIRAIIFAIVFVNYSVEAYILHKNKRSIGAAKIIMIVAFGTLFVMDFIKLV